MSFDVNENFRTKIHRRRFLLLDLLNGFLEELRGVSEGSVFQLGKFL